MSAKTNEFIRIENGVPVDERMTTETKEYMRDMLRSINLNDVAKLDASVLRKAVNELALEINKEVTFDNLTTKDTFILNPDDNFNVPIRIFTPTQVKPSSPITVFFHGGGWTINSIETHHLCVASLASHSKTIWISVEYRLAPEHRFHTQLSDCKLVLERVLSNREEFGGDAACQVGVCGDSAGGHYSAILSHDYRHQLSFQVLVYPCVDLFTNYESSELFTSDAYYLTPTLINFFLKSLLDDDVEMKKSQLISPLFRENFANLPKCLIIAAELDPLVDQSKVYHKKLLDHNNECDLKIVKGTIHGFFNNGYFLKDAFNDAQDRILEFYEKDFC
jgi:acetyl esterase